MKAISVLLPLTFLLLIGCQNKGNTQSSSLTHNLDKIEDCEIGIDSVAAGNFLHYQHLKHQGKEVFTFQNRVNQEIKFYDLTTRKIVFKVPVKREKVQPRPLFMGALLSSKHRSGNSRNRYRFTDLIMVCVRL